MSKLALLGGSSPFTAAWVDAVAASAGAVPPRELVLHGRHAGRLDLVARCARERLGPLGWRVRASTSWDDALDGADVVLHQVRYGGFEERAADEDLAARFGIAGDETLGPAGLRAAVRIVPHLRALAERLRRLCPQAWVLNLTNPLSVAVAVLSREGVRTCVGLCELPRTTARSACRLLGLDPAAVEWSYTGLNHRGFVHDLRHEGRDLLPELVQALGAEGLGGISSETVFALQALPVKYFRLLSAGYRWPRGRSKFLSELRARIEGELRGSVGARPPSLSGRSLDWYAEAVVPMFEAIGSGDGRVEMVNVLAGDVVVETKARVLSRHVEIVRAPRPSPPVQAWVARFAAHERAILAAATDPSEARLEAALALDPLVPAGVVQELAKETYRAANRPIGVGA